MSKTSILLLIALVTGFASFQTLKAASIDTAECVIINDTSALKNKISCTTDTLCSTATPMEISVATDIPSTDHPRKKKLVCALFALPFPCGFVGAHRVMLGTKPWVPIVYVATFGGCFGLLPLIDFCFITFSKDLTPYENNPHVFMWAK
jgi:TM2 domain-containing membrane protein YozV